VGQKSDHFKKFITSVSITQKSDLGLQIKMISTLLYNSQIFFALDKGHPNRMGVSYTTIP